MHNTARLCIWWHYLCKVSISFFPRIFTSTPQFSHYHISNKKYVNRVESWIDFTIDILKMMISFISLRIIKALNKSLSDVLKYIMNVSLLLHFFQVALRIIAVGVNNLQKAVVWAEPLINSSQCTSMYRTISVDSTLVQNSTETLHHVSLSPPLRPRRIVPFLIFSACPITVLITRVELNTLMFLSVYCIIGSWISSWRLTQGPVITATSSPAPSCS